MRCRTSTPKSSTPASTTTRRCRTCSSGSCGLPQPHISLTVGSAPHGAQTGRVLERFESALIEHQPAAVVVVGDVNSTLACALATAKLQYPDGSRPLLVHVEAGLRSRDRSMPEEVNRVLTDAISDLLFTTEESAEANLHSGECLAASRIHFVGNVMIDCLVNAWPQIETRRAWESLGLAPHSYGLVTLHRPSNVDHARCSQPSSRISPTSRAGCR